MNYSLCSKCYRHIEAELFESDGAMWIRKECPEHGSMAYLVDSADFYHKIHSQEHHDTQHTVLFDVTDKCNLNCPHCYHLPDNDSPDKPISDVIEEIKSIPSNFSIVLAGAEPTVRKDLSELVQEIKRVFNKPVGMLTNGIKFCDKNYLKSMVDSGMGGLLLLGVNYDNSENIREKQLEGLKNLAEFNLHPMVGITVKSYDHLEDIFRMIWDLYRKKVLDYGFDGRVRFRFGADIGRTTNDPVKTLSGNLDAIRKICDKLKISYLEIPLNNTLVHQLILIDGVPVRVIQWPNVENIVMDELQCGPWAKFIGPITNFCHQIILRDGIVNKRLPILDAPPDKYILK